MTTPRPDRRQVLRLGAAALAAPALGARALALPGEDPGPAWNRTAGRVVFVYTPNGLIEDAFRPAQAGALPSVLPASLLPLERLRARFSVVSGLTCDKARANGDGPGDHARASAAFLTGVQPLKTDGQIRLGISADQHLARSLRGRSRETSLALSMDPGRTTGQCDSGYSCAYQNHVSWLDATRPAALHHDPDRLFERLFRLPDAGLDERSARLRDERRERLLARADRRAAELERALPGADADRLGQYRDGLEQLRLRFRSGGAPQLLGEREPLASNAPYSARADAMGEVLALALEHDAAPVATWMLGQEGSNRRFDELGLDEGHHGLSHHQGEADKVEALRAIDALHLERLARFAERLAAVPAGASDLLAHTLIVFGSGIRDGNRHDHHDLPVLLLGGEALDLPPHLGRRERHLVHARETPFAGLLADVLSSFGAGRRGGGFGDAELGLSPDAVEGV